MYNEIYTPIFEYQKTLGPTEKSVFQLSGTLRMGDNKKALIA